MVVVVTAVGVLVEEALSDIEMDVGRSVNILEFEREEY